MIRRRQPPGAPPRNAARRANDPNVIVVVVVVLGVDSDGDGDFDIDLGGCVEIRMCSRGFRSMRSTHLDVDVDASSTEIREGRVSRLPDPSLVVSRQPAASTPMYHVAVAVAVNAHDHVDVGGRGRGAAAGRP